MKNNQWDIYANIYDEGIGRTGDKLHRDLIDPIIFQFLGNYRDLTIIDAGCGNGYLLSKLSKDAKQVIGIDASEKLLELARKNTTGLLNVVLKPCDLSRPWSIAQKFDIVIANMVLQYLPNLNIFSNESSRILKKDGVLIVTIDHPGHALFLRAQELIRKKNGKFLISGSYFQKGKRTKKSLWDKAILEYYHRPIKDYINTFTTHYYLDRMEELTDDGEMPRILALKWFKRREHDQS